MEIRVVASVIQKDGRVLICERPGHKRHGGLWEFPGGKVEPEETDLQAVARELEEELGVKVIAVGEVEYSVADPGSHFVIHFLPVEIDGDPQPLEHSALAWVTVDELLSMSLAPSDLKYADFRAKASTREALE